jgi:hypothetical protein
MYPERHIRIVICSDQSYQLIFGLRSQCYFLLFSSFLNIIWTCTAFLIIKLCLTVLVFFQENLITADHLF